MRQIAGKTKSHGHKIKYAAQALKERLGRNPTDEEIAQELGLTEQSVMALRLSDVKLRLLQNAFRLTV